MLLKKATKNGKRQSTQFSSNLSRFTENALKGNDKSVTIIDGR